MVIVGSVGLAASLFLAWSHQFSRAFLAEWGSSAQLQGIPHDPTAWQVYSTADVVLAVLAAALVAGRAARRAGASGSWRSSPPPAPSPSRSTR